MSQHGPIGTATGWQWGVAASCRSWVDSLDLSQDHAEDGRSEGPLKALGQWLMIHIVPGVLRSEFCLNLPTKQTFVPRQERVFDDRLKIP